MLAVGTTSLRVLESVALKSQGQLLPGAGRTQLFISPPWHFQIVDGLVTNFHLPQSTLLMLASAFAAPNQTRGREMILSAYAEAVRQRYRFFSYGMRCDRMSRSTVLPRPRFAVRSRLPFVYLNVAITADGKIAPANRLFQPFSSKRDQELLMQLRTRADAVMAGARTVDLFPANLGPGAKRFREMRLRRGLSEYNLTDCCQRRRHVEPEGGNLQSSIFTHHCADHGAHFGARLQAPPRCR